MGLLPRLTVRLLGKVDVVVVGVVVASEGERNSVVVDGSSSPLMRLEHVGC